MPAIRRIEKDRKRYILTFDEYAVIDTVSQMKDGQEIALNGSNRTVQFFVRHQDAIYAMQPVKGCTYSERT